MSDTPRTDARVRMIMDNDGSPEALESFARQLERELAEATSENNRLRAALATSKDPCLYCQLPKDEMAKCRSGFPGCARADDLMGCPELGAALEVDRQKRELAEAQLDAARYEYLRKLVPVTFRDLWEECVFKKVNFDAEVDRRRNQK